MLATSLAQLAKSKDSPNRFQPLDKQERQQFAQRGQDLQKFREERQKLETRAPAVPAGKSGRNMEPVKVKLPAAPIVARPATELAKGQIPPKPQMAPKPDLKVVPKPKKDDGKPEVPAAAPKPPTKGESKPPTKGGGKDKSKG